MRLLLMSILLILVKSCLKIMKLTGNGSKYINQVIDSMFLLPTNEIEISNSLLPT